MPTNMAITKSDDIFVTDGCGNRRIVHVDKDGNFVKTPGETLDGLDLDVQRYRSIFRKTKAAPRGQT